MDRKFEREEGKELWANFEKYTTFDDLTALYQKCVPKIESFEQ